MLRALGLLSLVAVATAQDIRSASQYEHMQAHENDASSYPQKPQQTQQSYHQPPEVHLQFNMPALNLTAVSHHAGEAAVGASAGAIAAWLVHRLQNTMLLLGVLGSISTAAALHLQWVSPDQVKQASVSTNPILIV